MVHYACPSCSKEVPPGARYCGFCSHDLRQLPPQLQPLPLLPASLALRLGSFLFDFLVTLWLLGTFLGLQNWNWQIAGSLVLSWIWVGLWNRVGRRSPGQQIFRLQALRGRLYRVPE